MTPLMIQETVDKRKNVTRRLAGLAEINKNPDDWESNGWAGSWGGFAFNHKTKNATRIIKPRYHAGEVVYIKEAWAAIKLIDSVKPRDILPCNYYPIWYKGVPDWQQHGINPWPGGDRGKWRSPLFLPERFARYFIRMGEPRLERLQEITEDDAKAEGLRGKDIATQDILSDKPMVYTYAHLWDSINPSHPFKNNYWVMVYPFELVEKQGR